ncbi:chemotaxis protein CheD [Amphritea balenae]|uniref:Probable chemoreceptor glutamine deamidase CheD n=1 Tax=Amphritea balenae TaxID=452629 RepID=A0A3P1SMU8_9GAMM|nr:chemotaxis protein CheD [Amphritea balenae]RRC98478.1 chemotaxis protein CheD [Amphritea balenae]GGK64808.1 putative chemoreceptor glutamine deamidase CheD [Amphritea balenae]
MNTANSFWEPQWQCQAFKISPGEYKVTDEPVVLTTVLGSCISACLHDPLLNFGGMNHFMLPDASSNSDPEQPLRYGLFAMEKLINKMMKLGSDRNNLEIKVCGGGEMMQWKTKIGRQNIDFIESFINRDGLKLTASDLGGSSPRKVAFFPTTGRLLIKKIKPQLASQLALEEQQYQSQVQVQQQLNSPDILLFGRES